MDRQDFFLHEKWPRLGEWISKLKRTLGCQYRTYRLDYKERRRLPWWMLGLCIQNSLLSRRSVWGRGDG